MLRFLTAGESHGPGLTAIIEGIPANLQISSAKINEQLRRRQGGYGRGGRMKIEQDQVEIRSGVRGGLALGSPITLSIPNRDWANWSEIMAPEDSARMGERVVSRPRPGHADLSGAVKYRQTDMRNILERASARETAARVAVGGVARCLLEALGVGIGGWVVRIGGATWSVDDYSWEMVDQARRSEVYCPDAAASQLMQAEIDAARAAGDTIGGSFEVVVFGLPMGLGSHVHWDRRLDGRLAGAVMSIPGIKGVEIGQGFRSAELIGSAVHDEIFYSPERGFYRQTNRAGGIEGGMTNGEPVVVRAAMKPIPTLIKPLQSVDMATKEPEPAAFERSDVCAVPAASVVGEAMVAWEIARTVLEKFPHDTMTELRESWEKYRDYLRQV